MNSDTSQDEIDETTKLIDKKSENDHKSVFAVQAFVGHANDLGNIILGSTYNESFEPLPFPNYRFFEEDESTLLNLRYLIDVAFY